MQPERDAGPRPQAESRRNLRRWARRTGRGRVGSPEQLVTIETSALQRPGVEMRSEGWGRVFVRYDDLLDSISERSEGAVECRRLVGSERFSDSIEWSQWHLCFRIGAGRPGTPGAGSTLPVLGRLGV